MSSRVRMARGALAAALGVLALGSSARATYCGAASYRCCPAPVVQAQCNVVALAPQCQNVVQTAYETVYENQPYTVMETRYRMAYRTETYPVMRPVYRTTNVTRTYNVMRPVYQTSYRQRTYNVMRPV